MFRIVLFVGISFFFGSCCVVRVRVARSFLFRSFGLFELSGRLDNLMG